MRKAILFFLFASVFFWQMLMGPAYAEKVCFECHDRARFSGKVVHKPVDQLQCGVCHNPHVARYPGLLRNREDRLCYSCHEDREKVFHQGVVHAPVADGSCSVCHTPHVSDNSGLVRDNLNEVCFNCHAKMPREFSQTHKPFAEGRCTVCHKPHQADNLELLADSPDNLCFSCHEPASLQQGHRDYPGTLRSCLSCHSPHGSDRAALVRNILHKPYEQGCKECHDTPAGITMSACLKCHESVQEEMLKTRSHLTLHEGNSCLNCHSPHAGDTPYLLKTGERQICTSCHEVTVAGYRDSAFKHPDINKCNNCHDSHASRHLAMLRGDGNDVCIECHKVQGKFSHPVGPEVLDPLTGQMMTCVTCHKPMGTDYEHHLVMDGNKPLCNQCHISY